MRRQSEVTGSIQDRGRERVCTHASTESRTHVSRERERALFRFVLRMRTTMAVRYTNLNIRSGQLKAKRCHLRWFRVQSRWGEMRLYHNVPNSAGSSQPGALAFQTRFGTRILCVRSKDAQAECIRCEWRREDAAERVWERTLEGSFRSWTNLNHYRAMSTGHSRSVSYCFYQHPRDLFPFLIFCFWWLFFARMM